MAKRKQSKGYASKKAAAAARQQNRGQRRRATFMSLIILFIVMPLVALGVTFFRGEDAPEPAASSGDWQVMAAERPLAADEPASRVDSFSAPPAMAIDTTRSYRAVFVTEKGEMTFDLFDDQAPLTVNNFVFLVNQGFYDGTTFHRVLEDFMAQGGDPLGIGSGGPGYRFADEFDPSLRFDRAGLLAMANSGPGTNGSQFFITFGPTEWLNDAHTIFGALVEGEDVLKSIRLRAPESDPQPGDRIERIDILEK